MSTKQKKTQPIPEIYQHLTNRSPSLLKMGILVDLNNNITLFETPHRLESMESYKSLIVPSIMNRWDNHDAFNEQGKNTILTWHSNLFNAEPPKGQSLLEASLYCWYELCHRAKNRLMNTAPTDPSTGRKSSITTRKYFIGNEPDITKTQIKTPQALACYKIFTEELSKTGTNHISEGDLKTKVIERAPELKTRQDPWRIFQYYRPQLISAKLIRYE